MPGQSKLELRAVATCDAKYEPRLRGRLASTSLACAPVGVRLTCSVICACLWVVTRVYSGRTLARHWTDYCGC